MENRDDLFKEIPFYMTYPMQNLYLTEMEYEKDMERMKELYPREVQELQQMVEKRCDEMEYEGSRMYDENPDRRMLEEEAKRLLERFLRENPQYGNMRPMPRPDTPMPRPDMPMPPRMGMPIQPRQGMSRTRETGINMQEYNSGNEISAQNRRPSEDPWLRSLIGILFHDEIYRRRCRNRRCRRWW